jgi:hypothetical protein
LPESACSIAQRPISQMVCETTSPFLANPSARKSNCARASRSCLVGTATTVSLSSAKGVRISSSSALIFANRTSASSALANR